MLNANVRNKQLFLISLMLELNLLRNISAALETRNHNSAQLLALVSIITEVVNQFEV